MSGEPVLPEIFGFGYCPAIRLHSIEVLISDTDVVFQENTHGGRCDRRIIAKAVLSRRVWHIVVDLVARELNRLIKGNVDLKKCRKAKWDDGRNEVDLNLGRELVVLAWALEHTPDTEIMRVADSWSGMDSIDRFYFYRLINQAGCGELENVDTFMRKGFAMIMRGREEAV